MQRSDYGFRDLALDQYEAIVTAAEIFKDDAGNAIVSPLHGAVNHDSLIAACKADDVDPRLDLACMLWEDHDGTDPNGGIALAKVYNFSGIKWAGQANAYDAGIPCPPDEGGTYAGFANFGAYAVELHRTYNNVYIGPYFKSGDLANAFSVYITGKPFTGKGQGRIDTWLAYQRQYPGIATDAPDTNIYGDDLIARARALIGQAFSSMETDPVNGVHPWAFWCESFAERVPEYCGLSITHRGSATAKGQAYIAQGLAQRSWPPEHGAHVVMGPAFWGGDSDGDGQGDGHIGFWDSDKGMLLSTVTDGTGIGYMAIGPSTPGLMCWARVPGVAGAYRPQRQPPAPAASDNWVPEGNPYNEGRDHDHRLGFGGAIRDLVKADPAWLEGVYGWPMTNEYDGLLCTPIGGGLYRIVKCTLQDTQRQRIVFESGIARIPLRWEICGPADDPAVVAVVNDMKAATR